MNNILVVGYWFIAVIFVIICVGSDIPMLLALFIGAVWPIAIIAVIGDAILEGIAYLIKRYIFHK